MQALKVPEWLKDAPSASGAEGSGKKTASAYFVDKLLRGLGRVLRLFFESESVATNAGFLQSMDPVVKIICVLLFVVSAGLAQSAYLIAALVVVAYASCLASKARVLNVVKRAFVPTALTLAVMAPSVVIGFGGMEESLGRYLIMSLRVFCMASFVALLVTTTRISVLFGAMRRLPVPSFFVSALFMTYRYALLLIKVLEDSALAYRSRAIGMDRVGGYDWLLSRAAFIMRRSLELSDEVYSAMRSRGFTGEVIPLQGARIGVVEATALFLAIFTMAISAGF